VGARLGRLDSGVRRTASQEDSLRYHGWKVVAGGMFVQSLQSGLFWQAFGAYAALWMADFGWTRTTIAIFAALQRTESGLLGPLHGMFLDRTSVRTVFLVGVFMTGLGMIGISFAGGFASLLSFYLIASIGASFGGLLTLMTAVVNHFERRRARALSVLQLGISVGSLALPLVAWALVTFGWRPVSFVSGLITIAVGLPIAGLLRVRPEATAQTQADPSGDRLGFRQILRSPSFWWMSSGHAAAMAVMSGVGVHFVIFLIEVLGFSVPTAAALVTLMTAVSIVGQVVGGLFGDRIDKRVIAGGAMLLHATAMALLAFAGGFPMVLIAAVLHGFAWGARGPLMGAMRADYFGRKAFASVMGYSSLIVMIGSVAGPLLVGILTDTTGAYTTAFATLAVVASLGSAAFFALRRPPVTT
jgi:MFS family permease